MVVLGAGKTGYMVVKTLLKTPGLGLSPVAVLDDDPQKRGDIEGVPVIGGVEVAPHLAKKLKLRYAILAMPGVPRERLLYLIERYASLFSHLLLIPDLFGFASLWVYPKDLNGILCLEVRQQLLRIGPRVAKSVLTLRCDLRCVRTNFDPANSYSHKAQFTRARLLRPTAIRPRRAAL